MLLLMGCMTFGIGVLALWKTADTAHNVLTLGSYNVELKEQYEVPKAVYPGMSVDKKVHVKNHGSVDSMVRIHFQKQFGTRTQDGIFQKDDSLDPELIEITCNDQCWKEKDGYWYYTEVLKAGEQTKEPLFESFRVSENADNRYKGKEAEIIVYMDSVQAESDALTLWNTTKEELNIDYDWKTADQDTSVIFHGERKGFSFSDIESDLFANFKHLVPGCSRTQKIQVKNQSDKETDIYLYAEVTEQDKLNQEEQKLLEQILHEDAQIMIRDGQKKIYEGPVSGNPTKNHPSMGEQNRILLGNFSADSEKELIVELSLSPKLDHSCKSLTGRINWVFCAEGEDTSTASYVPKTGDQTRWLMYISLAVLSAMIIGLLLYRRNKA